MGVNQSKPNEVNIKGIDGNKNHYDILDLIATNYITTQNFKDLKNLIKPEYCDKLIILTTDVINNYLKETKIKYLAKNEMSTSKNLKDEGIIFIQSKGGKNTLDKNRHGGGDDGLYPNYRDSNNERRMKRLAEHLDERRHRYGSTYNDKKTKLNVSYLDVKEADKKQRMCIGIAKFYVTIAHLWSAILLSVNPQYKYTDHTGKKTFVSFEDRDRLQKDAKVELTTENSICGQRLKVLNSTDENTINLERLCEMNKVIHNKTGSKGYAPSEWGEEIISKNLTNEMGIPELEMLYNNYYDYESGRFSHRIPNSKTDKQYKKDLKLLYTNFTGNIDYNEWNKDGTKTFKDVILSQFNEGCSSKIDKDGRKMQPVLKMKLILNNDNNNEVIIFKN